MDRKRSRSSSGIDANTKSEQVCERECVLIDVGLLLTSIVRHACELLDAWDGSIGLYDERLEVFRTEAIDACLVAELPPEPEGRVYIGVDWARYEDFPAVAVLAGYRESCRLLHIERMTGLTWNEQVRRVAEIVGQHRYASVLCDATGVGDVALEMLQVALPRQGIQGLVFTAPEA